MISKSISRLSNSLAYRQKRGHLLINYHKNIDKFINEKRDDPTIDALIIYAKALKRLAAEQTASCVNTVKKWEIKE